MYPREATAAATVYAREACAADGAAEQQSLAHPLLARVSQQRRDTRPSANARDETRPRRGSEPCAAGVGGTARLRPCQQRRVSRRQEGSERTGRTGRHRDGPAASRDGARRPTSEDGTASARRHARESGGHVAGAPPGDADHGRIREEALCVVRAAASGAEWEKERSRGERR